MPLPRGLHDIKTRTSVARNKGRAGNNSSPRSPDWNVDDSVYKKGPKGVRRSRIDVYLKERMRRRLIELVQVQLEDLEQAMAERIPVSASELRRLRARLSQLETE